MNETTQMPEEMVRRLRWPLRLTYLGLWAERVVRAFWPVWSLICLAVAVLAFGLQDAVTIKIAWVGLVLWLGALLGALWRGLRGFRRPRRVEALERLDRSMPGHPISAVLDRLALGAGDEASAGLWQLHVARMAERSLAARPVSPDLRLATRDPFALRYGALLALVMALGFGAFGPLAGVSSLIPGSTSVAAGPAWEGWIQPPPYTGKPALYLNDIQGDALDVPVGSKLTLRLYGRVGALKVEESVSGRQAAAAGDSEPSQSFTIAHSGKLAVDGRGGRAWAVQVIPDLPPQVEIAGPLVRLASGKMRLPFHASDDYGVISGKAIIRLDLGAVERRYGLAPAPEPRPQIVLDLPMPINGSRRDFTQTLVEDLAQNAWANLPVDITLTVRDAAGQVATATRKGVVLPGRRFFDPLAAAVVEIRRDLLWSRQNARRSDEILRALTWRPAGFIKDQSVYLQLRAVIAELDGARTNGLSPAARDHVAAALWKVALQLEDGTLSNALDRLSEVQKRLSEAIRRGASPDEIAKLMQQFDQALRDYMAQLLQHQQNQPNRRQAQNQQQMRITGLQMQQLLDRLQQLMEQGRMAEAQQLLDRLREMTRNMQVAEGADGMGLPGQQALNDMGQTLRQQQNLSDQAFQQLQRQFGNPGQSPGQGQSDQGPPGQGQGSGQGAGQGDAARQLADRQQALRQQLQRQRQSALPGGDSADGKAGRQALDQAGRAMDRAAQALRQGDLPRALDEQARAMDALREGLRSLDRAMAAEQGANTDGMSQADGRSGPNGQSDPLGRQIGQGGALGGRDVNLQGGDVYRRAQQILDELRRRSGDRSRPEIERQYIRRLLQLF